MGLINTKFNKLDLVKLARNIDKTNRGALTRTLNILSKRGIKITAKDLQEQVGVKQATVRRLILVTKATNFKLFFKWSVSGERLPWIKPLVIRGGVNKRGGRRLGVSYLSGGKKRIKGNTKINGGTKPFIVKTKYSKNNITREKKIAVYRQKGYKRKVTKLVYHSIPYILDKNFKIKIQNLLLSQLTKEYYNQVNRSKYVKKF